MERLQKVMARAGVASRRQCEELIKSGQVKVNGKITTELGIKVDPEADRIEVRGKRIQSERKRTFLFYKPMFVITSMSDPQGRKVVADYFGKIPERVYPVGRLDYDTEGLLLLTNDGELANRLTHPRYEVDKVYLATVKGKPTCDSLERLQKGVRLEDGWTAPARVRLIQAGENRSKIELTIHEGRNRQVRRMCEAIGYPVRHLIRTRLAFLTLNGLKRGDYRELTPAEISRLKQLLRG
ncbi:pseudouridine synthase [Paenactinomyces guangxiensis]|uniref:Pseudouridine synthase n=1 Tax=Paenactinomyces guangxiensis TaxID=1490290 RepID=A0A7W2AA92_9BACL|nr:pseudouridine synthase [Paenactinomyces guangxiensis]MBA4495648.1 rRNA pseudouridine synthase [Paenactinomyces guangxiensis]MBH8592636.1 rRNA pseudouridine synthase [Paenactinomyces guangxiensis]